ncbi:murein hydrolase activator EnvC family protein [Phytohalomonas tamaricis]|uniref:murein hydrolase activator EnvC family protein n=1 Tax=Phytohalomonas tamaricis TaxID=2081032 RepID=UPI000D0B4E7A|nr:peptidoglycan DD-metalloendopeptidase family protein [Phytohalomonas tamaricis]
MSAEDVSRQQLKAISADIEASEKRIHDTGSERKSAQQALRQAEAALAETYARIDQLQSERESVNAQLQALNGRHDQLVDERNAQQQALATQLAALYRLGEQPQLKLLLNGGDPTKLERYQHYLNRINEVRRERLDAIAALDRDIDDNRTQAKEERERLNQLLDDLDDRRQRLAEQQDAREQIVAKLNTRYANEQARLEDLRSDRAHVEQLLKQMERELAQAKAKREAASQQLTEDERSAEPTRSASSRQSHDTSSTSATTRTNVHRADKGAASSKWPVNGRLISRFGQGEGIDRNGVLLAASAGTSVRAAGSGQIVFANWMRGFGYLVIIDHGKGILTLYAHNQRLTVKAGDSVERGAIIATVGNSGGRSGPALYFEVRRRGQPIDPNRWTASR